MRTKPPRARSIVRTIHSTAHPVDPVRPIILQLIHPSVRAADDPSSLPVRRQCPTVRLIVRPTDDPMILSLIHLIVCAADNPSSWSIRRPSPTVRPNVRSTEDPTGQPDGYPSPFPMHPVMPSILTLTHPIIHAFDDPLILLDGRPSPTFHLIVRPTDDQSISLFIHPIILPNDDPFIQSVGRPSPIQSDPSVHATFFHRNHLNRLPDSTPNSLESSEEGYSTAMSEWPALLQVEMETFLFHTFET